MRDLEKVVRHTIEQKFGQGLIDENLFIKANQELDELIKADGISKQAALYIFRPETQYTCDKCVFAKDKAQKCALFGGGEDIKPYGACGFWIHQDPNQPNSPVIPYLGTVTKQEAGYEENKQGFSCKRCEYFVVGKNDCMVVDKSSEGDTSNEIHPNACCNAWEGDNKRAKMTSDQLNKLLAK